MSALSIELIQQAALGLHAQKMALLPQHLTREYTPLGAARKLFDSDARDICLVGPANTGKTRACLELLHRDALQYPNSRQLIVRQTRKSLVQSTLVTYETKVLPPNILGEVTSKKPIVFHGAKHQYQYPNGSVIAIGGLDAPEDLFSTEWDRVYIGEVSQVSLDAYDLFHRGLRHKHMPKQQLISDMNPTHDLHWMHQRCDEGLTLELLSTHDDNPSITSEELATLDSMLGERRERLFLGHRVADTEGTYYGKLLSEARVEGRMHKDLVIDRALPVYTSWDLGVADFTTIWFWQVSGREFWVIDYYEMAGEGLGHYAKVLQDKGYLYATHYMPHDIKARMLAASSETRLEILTKLLPGHRFYVVSQVRDVADRIEATRAILPRCHFDQHKAAPDQPEQRNTAQGVQRLLGYKRAVSEALGTFLRQPKHDEASHAADAFGTFAQGFAPPRPRIEATRQQVVRPR